MKLDYKLKTVHIIGAGLAGSEAAWHLAESGVPVLLHEMRPKKQTFAHKSSKFAELVCSNSFRSNNDRENAVGLLHWEMMKANGLIIRVAQKNSIPAGGALAVNRDEFSEEITQILKSHPLIKFNNNEVEELPENDCNVIIATGPLTSEKLVCSILKHTDESQLYFFDAISPIVYADSIDYEKAWFQSRYDKGETYQEKKAYLNCPLNKDQYESFIKDLINSEKTEFKEWEKNSNYFNGCLPIEVMAERGSETLRYGPMKPKGLTNPRNKVEKPHAVVQLRLENKNKTLYNIVGFQTKMKHDEQKRVLRKIPGLKNVRFARLGGIHRNTYINSPKLLNERLQLRSSPNIRFAGQITGVEGYIESAAIGMLSAIFLNSEIKNIKSPRIPDDTSMGCLLNHITNEKVNKDFQPMNINFGLFPKIENQKKGRKNKKNRYIEYTNRAKLSWNNWLENYKRLNQ